MHADASVRRAGVPVIVAGRLAAEQSLMVARWLMAVRLPMVAQ
jgi:hypothetical protein